MRRAAVHQRLSGGIGDKAGALVAEAAQHMPHPLGRPFRERDARARDIGGGSVGGAAFVLLPPRDLPRGDLFKHAGEQLHADGRQFHVEFARRPATRQRNRFLGGDVAGIDALVDPVDGHGGVAVVIPIGPENSIDAAVPRQRRGMHVERADAGRGEHACRNDPRK